MFTRTSPPSNPCVSHRAAVARMMGRGVETWKDKRRVGCRPERDYGRAMTSDVLSCIRVCICICTSLVWTKRWSRSLLIHECFFFSGGETRVQHRSRLEHFCSHPPPHQSQCPCPSTSWACHLPVLAACLSASSAASASSASPSRPCPTHQAPSPSPTRVTTVSDPSMPSQYHPPQSRVAVWNDGGDRVSAATPPGSSTRRSRTRSRLRKEFGACSLGRGKKKILQV